MHPFSWWWTAEHDFLSRILYTLQGANWQRAGGRGAEPRMVERPDDKPMYVRSKADLLARRKAQNAELARRRAAKEQRKRGA
ncbi:hypothetical protein [Mycobacterium marinum]|uniref:hypothetical protein n=1 Tax=Mycobacterium marinum TaxID=1781 RepID=UPI000B9608D5|nr:hypothetical protein [Mycobacterium marinum]